MLQSMMEDVQELANMPLIKGVFAAVWCWALEMVGYPESAALWLFYLMLLDLALGFCRAWDSGSIRGSKLKDGAFKFFRYWVAVAVFVMVEAPVIKALPIMPFSLRDAFIAYLSINEAFSCVDHLAYFKMPVPEGFIARLRNYRDASVAGDVERN